MGTRLVFSQHFFSKLKENPTYLRMIVCRIGWDVRERLDHRSHEQNDHDGRRDEAPADDPIAPDRLAGHELEVATEAAIAVDVDDGENFEERHTHERIAAGEVIEHRDE